MTLTNTNFIAKLPNDASTDADVSAKNMLDNVLNTYHVNPPPGIPVITAVTSSKTDGTYTIGEQISITITFDQAVDVTGIPQLTLETGTIDRVIDYVAGSGSNTLTFSYTVQTGDSSGDLDYHNAGALALNGGTIKLAGDTADADLTLATPGTANSLGANQALVINTSIPAVNNVTISSATGIQNNSLNAGDVVSVTVTMSEDTTVTGTPQLALNIGGASVNADYSSGSGSTALVFSYTIAAGLNDSDGISIASNSINLNGGSLNSALGNAADLSHTAVADNSNYLVDTSKPATPAVPTLDMTSDSGVSSSDGKTNVNTPTFSGVTEAFATVNLYDTGGTVILGTTTADSSGNWSITVSQDPATMSPLAGSHSVSVRAVDRAGNSSNASGNTNITIDTTAPALAQSITLSDTALKTGDTAIITIKFTEAVNGFTTADLNVPNGRITGLTTSNGGITWTGTLTPNANVTDTTNLVLLDNTGYADVAGNAGIGSSNSPNYTIDTVRPTLASAITISDTALKIGDTATVTLVFSEAITGFTVADLTATNGTLSNLTTSDGGITWTVMLTPNANASNNNNVIELDYTGVNDLNGNAGTGSATSGNYGVDTLRPTATVVVASSNLTAANTSLVTITFNEAVSGFSNANLTVANGSLSAMTSGNGGITWTATLTPASGVVAASNVITLNYTGVSDSAGNTATGTTNSNNYAITAGVNLAPTDISLSSSGIAQTAADNTSVGTLIATDPNPGDTASFSLDAGVGSNSNDNNKFSISGNSLIAKRPLDMAPGNYTVLVRATDAAGSAYEKSLVVTVADNIAPFVTAIKRVQSENSNLGTLEYKVSFSEAVTGVNPAAFSLLTTGSVGGSISGITQLDASNYIVSISNLTGDGTLGLNLKNTGTGIADKANLALNGGFTGQLYQIDHTGPSTGISKLSFSNDDGVSNSDFITTASVQTISGSLSAPLAADERVLVSPDNGNSWLAATVNPGAQQWALAGQTLEGSNTLLIKVSDAAGNAGSTLSQNYSILKYDAVIDSDADGDGAYMSAETQVPNIFGDGLGDGNGDGIADQSQNAVTSLQWLDHSSSPHYLTLSNTQHVLQKEVATNAAVINSATEIQFPYGRLSAQLGGFSNQAEVSLSLYTTADSTVNGFWTQTSTGEWISLATNITATSNKLKVDFKIKDGGLGDLDGKADGKISFSAGLGYKAETIAVKPSTSLPGDKDGDGIPDAVEARVGTKLDIKDNDVFHRSDLFVMQLYRDVLFREADAAGVQYWQQQIDSGKLSRAEVAASFMESTEFQNGIGGITRLYFGAFDRLPDREGLAYWMQAQKEGMNLSKISTSFVASAEFQKTYGNLNNTTFVDHIYQNVLHRSSNAAGKAYWLGQLGNGLSRGDMLAGFTESTEFKATSQAKVSLTLDYIGLLGHAPDQVAFDALLAQSGTDMVTLIGQFLNTPEYLARFMPE